MAKLMIDITDELRSVLDRLAENLAERRGDWIAKFAAQVGSANLGPIVETILRQHPMIDLVREELGLEWQERPKRGRPKLPTA